MNGQSHKMKGHVEKKKLKGHQFWECMIKGHKLKGHIAKKVEGTRNMAFQFVLFFFHISSSANWLPL
jgi:hypothetical protein